MSATAGDASTSHATRAVAMGRSLGGFGSRCFGSGIGGSSSAKQEATEIEGGLLSTVLLDIEPRRMYTKDEIDFLQGVTQRAVEFRMTPRESGLLQHTGADSRTGQQQFVCHFSEHHTGNEGRQGKQGGTYQDLAKRPGELEVGGWCRGHGIDRASD